jgi:uncharacterized protein YutE (UPF0331/DUF86 family)
LLKLGQYIAELEKQQQATLETFRNDTTRQLAVERAFQAAIESCTDIASHIVSTYQLGHPQESRDVYRFLMQAGYLDATTCETMTAMVGLRNRIVHLYWDIDTVRLYDYLSQDVEPLHAFRDFALQVLAADQEVGPDAESA